MAVVPGLLYRDWGGTMRHWIRGLAETKQELLVGIILAVIVIGFVLLIDLIA